ncbi:MAG: RelA/SpoT domain-containing protein [Candidatus Roizmanbacteria bacterium]
MTQRVTYQEVSDYLEKNEYDIYQELKRLQYILKNDKIYLIKHRIKKPESIYLKTKRKNKPLNEIYDYGGLRLLCLFEEDIFEVHTDFITMLGEKDYELKFCSVYNWDEPSIKKFEYKITECFDECVFEKIRRSSGYKSVHYVIKRKSSSVRIEIQLRTLVQDVWGELEHSISYKKGGVHPHIKKSFSLLSQEFLNVEDLLRYLKDVNKKEYAGEEYYNKLVTPKYFFKYENTIEPNFTEINENLYDAVSEYWKIIEELIVHPLINDSWIKSACNKLEKCREYVNLKSESENQAISYWLGMEKAFLLFCEARHKEALDEYIKLLDRNNDRYCVHFRIGELYFLLGDIEKSLQSFDESERLLTAEGIDHVNHYRIKSKLAYYYWSLGDEYIDIAVEEIDAAGDIYSQYKECFDMSQYEQLVNNMCWYKLEQYIVISKKLEAEGKDSAGNDSLLYKKQKTYDELKIAYAAIESLINEGNYESSNLLDTAAWYWYWEYKEYRDSSYLIKAKKYALSMDKKILLTSYPQKSIKIHMKHIQEIMSVK